MSRSDGPARSPRAESPEASYHSSAKKPRRISRTFREDLAGSVSPPKTARLQEDSTAREPPVHGRNANGPILTVSRKLAPRRSPHQQKTP
ncbi:hypothetical protein Nepgr_020010 [Nepenthes gracilis]|uniref:Uncharacterized protein n=1 Tax=Nepenthes gracilis TaxID=150966 RepID=A0AAD3SWV5_NEPGR|nr:hypothetical protein Nepgr_020010 [Nepenthes gracilis]